MNQVWQICSLQFDVMKPRSQATGHRGNKAHLPSKPCAVCGLPMTWRRCWAKNWEQVKYCSQACRRQRASVGL
ncbi:hypothetical protein RB25_18220 [Herbaspirillum rubrisubalbicans]|uniref:DUF2256 domain-containing protein n=3 Tax=Herbaspirillum TaxID=963 RepID=A0ABX9C1T7_9BURK|nr:DUF2256 domain-containing protein [Herbaspirillum rubrisubalbicans Os34]RAM64365.1 hypothetical protein RB24_12175 [Herbaspirillum rubrisubalbicans]RAN45696.1 hypothetical protein RB25_18220 [Herbaspirillum rubrisubalbicans]